MHARRRVSIETKSSKFQLYEFVIRIRSLRRKWNCETKTICASLLSTTTATDSVCWQAFGWRNLAVCIKNRGLYTINSSLIDVDVPNWTRWIYGQFRTNKNSLPQNPYALFHPFRIQKREKIIILWTAIKCGNLYAAHNCNRPLFTFKRTREREKPG